MVLIADAKNNLITECHYKPNRVSLNEVSGLDYHREANGTYSIYTVGSDGTMRCFNSKTH